MVDGQGGPRAHGGEVLGAKLAADEVVLLPGHVAERAARVEDVGVGMAVCILCEFGGDGGRGVGGLEVEVDCVAEFAGKGEEGEGGGAVGTVGKGVRVLGAAWWRGRWGRHQGWWA